jgi:hypothetical protein
VQKIAPENAMHIDTLRQTGNRISATQKLTASTTKDIGTNEDYITCAAMVTASSKIKWQRGSAAGDRKQQSEMAKKQHNDGDRK